MIHYIVSDTLVPPPRRLPTRLYRAIERSFFRVLPEVSGDVAVTYVTPQEIQRLNRMYRGKDAVTDVLSFPLAPSPLSRECGDVLICFDKAQMQAEDGDVELELVDLVVHGTLHVLGYDHEEAEEARVMFSLQDDLVAYSL